jgi:hypothetical protein
MTPWSELVREVRKDNPEARPLIEGLAVMGLFLFFIVVAWAGSPA